MSSKPDIIRALADRGLDLHRANWIGRTFLHGCAEKGDVEAAGVFLELGADISAIELEYGGMPLASASRKGQVEMVRLLLDKGSGPSDPRGVALGAAALRSGAGRACGSGGDS